MNKVPTQKGSKSRSGGTLGALEYRYGSSKKLAQEATQAALQKATNQKMLATGKTATGQPADPVVVDPVSNSMQQSQTTM